GQSRESRQRQHGLTRRQAREQRRRRKIPEKIGSFLFGSCLLMQSHAAHLVQIVCSPHRHSTAIAFACLTARRVGRLATFARASSRARRQSLPLAVEKSARRAREAARGSSTSVSQPNPAPPHRS